MHDRHHLDDSSMHIDDLWIPIFLILSIILIVFAIMVFVKLMKCFCECIGCCDKEGRVYARMYQQGY